MSVCDHVSSDHSEIASIHGVHVTDKSQNATIDETSPSDRRKVAISVNVSISRLFDCRYVYGCMFFTTGHVLLIHVHALACIYMYIHTYLHTCTDRYA